MVVNQRGCNEAALDGGMETHDCGHNHCTTEHHEGCVDQLRFERYRLETFDSWPMSVPVDKRDLARNGFYYLGKEDRVQCVFCKVILHSWEENDTVEEEHRRLAPLCPFVRDPTSCRNFPLSYRQLNRLNSVHHVGPKHPEYADREIRLRSFGNQWINRTPTPGNLANAGFFYLGIDDWVKCFYCGGSLKNWEETDDVWDEHKRWYPLCVFVAEHDPVTHPELQRHLHRTISGIALENGYSDDDIQGFKGYLRENELPYPDEYGELVSQLDQYKERVAPSAPVLLEETSGAEESTSPQQSRNGAESDSDRYLCKVCYDKPLEMIFYPCKHVCCCQTCSDKLTNCPLCRKGIRGRLQIFFP